VTLVLNSDGTIAANLTTFRSDIIAGFGINSTADFPQSEFSVSDLYPTEWVVFSEPFKTGFACNGVGGSCNVTNIQWTIGTADEFSAVFQLLGGPNPYDFFLHVYNDPIAPFYFGDANGPNAAPLHAALPLFATGLGALGLLGCRRKRKAQAV
jgi:hypothetical protein